MNMITLQNSSQTEVTILSNRFIDTYMPEANGEFVKVYIYLLRILAVTPASFSLEVMADRLLCTERDIFRALKYWEKAGLMTLHFDASQKLSGIILTEGTPAEQAAPTVPAEQAVTAAGTASDTSPTLSSASETAAAVSADATPSRTVRLTPDRIKELKQNEEIVQLLYIAEQYLGKTLTPTEIQKILFFYDELNFSADLIEYLLEYCVSRNHKSIRYMETVALSWAQEGITTVQMAKENTSRYAKEYYSILKAMGIAGRNPVDDEIAFMDVWMKNYGFDMPLIQEACSRTVLKLGQPSFPYADKILSGWKKKNVHSLEDIKILDLEHQKRAQERPKQNAAPKAANRFNNFHQRDYNFEEYEKRLLNSQAD